MKDTFNIKINNDDIHLASCLANIVSIEHNTQAYSHTLTVIGQAITPYLLKGVLDKLKNVFSPVSAAFHHLHQQMGDDAIEIRGQVINAKPEHIKSLLGDVSDAYHLDVGLQASRPSLSEPGLLVMDMDSTVIAIECIDEIAKLAGVGEQVAEVTARAMRGEIAFNDSLTHRVACLEGVPIDHLNQIRDGIPIMPGIQTLLSHLKKHRWKLAIASGGFTFFADHLKARLGLDYAISNTLSVKDGHLTGKVEGEIINADVKARTVKALSEKWQIPSSQTVAMGDGANDLIMMAESALGVACHGKPLVNEKADVAVRVGSLHSLLYFLDK
ncbi:phosphoserine phosphatase SerB [Alteromonas sp. BL110]|uniref:phosphoserine phosphatase SerB n=1 Tax=Alteromonas sp. BL110 TaxID=1714845 RepID=UPI000E48A938|nr:phosphoserine phosphatase SerB [Alteromonas sp. BL110]AXT39770.1 phosphoserine phosphatase SerB [Alteromonas sp. BL110]RKM81743.1 phosphoserine phosphatase SerB [Alteromonas sp. BL110]